jgi:hypothetical protein
MAGRITMFNQHVCEYLWRVFDDLEMDDAFFFTPETNEAANTAYRAYTAEVVASAQI